MIKQVKKLVTKLIALAYQLSYRLIPIKPKRIVFISYHGRGYVDNPKAIYEAICADPQYQDYELLWIFRDLKADDNLIRGRAIKYLTPSYFYALASSKYWVVNFKMPNYLKKKANQVYLQTWHGTPLKRLAHDIEVSDDTKFYRSGMTKEQMQNTYDIDVAKYNYMISPSPYTTEVFQSAFKINRERLIETGYPRNDILVNYDDELLTKIRNKYQLPNDKKIILYAPTWRDNSFNLSGYTFKLPVDFGKWYEALKDEYIVLFKPHYLIVNDFDLSKYQDFVYFMNADSEISELYLISDILITDYSSVFFDYAILKRPIYFYMPDLSDYQDNLRGFYLDIYQDLPGSIYTDESLLVSEIANNKFDYNNLAKFNNYYNLYEDGGASKRVLAYLFKDNYEA